MTRAHKKQTVTNNIIINCLSLSPFNLKKMDKRLNGRNKTLLFDNNSNRKEKSIRWKMIVLMMFVLCIQLICFPVVYVNGYYMKRQQNELQSQANQEEQKWSTRKNSRDHDSSGETTPFTYFSSSGFPSTQRPLIQPHSVSALLYILVTSLE